MKKGMLLYIVPLLVSLFMISDVLTAYARARRPRPPWGKKGGEVERRPDGRFERDNVFRFSQVGFSQVGTITLEDFEDFRGLFRGRATVGSPPAMRPSFDGKQGKSAEIKWFGDNEAKDKRAYRSIIPFLVFPQTFSGCTELSLWVKTSQSLEGLSLFIGRRDNLYAYEFPQILGDDQWHKIRISLFGDLISKGGAVREEIFDPGEVEIIQLSFPLSRPGVLKLDQVEIVRRGKGDLPKLNVLPIEDEDDSIERINIEAKELETLANGYRKLALQAGPMLLSREKIPEALEKINSAQQSLLKLEEAFKQFCDKGQDRRQTFGFFRESYKINRAKEANESLMKRLETWNKIEDGTLISISPPRIQEGCCVHDVTYSSDGLKVTGILTRPCKGGPYPVIVANHGGFGDARFFDDYRALKFAKAGYVVFAPDYRGTRTSEGRGGFRIENSNIIRERTFQKKLEEHRDGRRVLGVIHDILNAIRFVKTLPYVDKNRIAIFAHSMGHIASRLTLERTSEVRAAVLVAAFLVENPAELKKISCPVMLAYGDQDRKAPPEKGYELRDILKKYGKHVEFQIFYGKDHSTIVDAALDRALAFYDGQLERKED